MRTLLNDLFGIHLPKIPRWIVIEPTNFTVYFLCTSFMIMLLLSGSNGLTIYNQKHERHNELVWAWTTIRDAAIYASETTLDSLFLQLYENRALPASSFNGHVERDTVIKYSIAK